VPEEGAVLVDDRPTEMREDGRRYFVGTNELADAEETYPGDPARGFAMGGMAHSFGSKPESSAPSYALAEAESPPPVFSTLLPMKTGGAAKKATRRAPAKTIDELMQRYTPSGKATLADMARHYGMRR